MSSFNIQATADKLDWAFDFSNEVQEGETVTAIDVTVPSGLVQESKTDNLASNKTVVVLSGISHAGLIVVQATATKNNGVKATQSLTIRGWFGGA